MSEWQGMIALNHIKPRADDIIIRSTIEICENDVMDGKTLGREWQRVVQETHPEYGDMNKQVNPAIFMPLDLDRFLAIRCRAVSGMEKWGCNVNGDAFPSSELEKSYLTLIAKGFYEEHDSFDPINAIGILAHAQWLAEEQYVVCVALVDKIMFPQKAEMIRNAFRNSKKAGVSIGCIAGTAECSICGNIARNLHQVCAHMDRSNPGCIKGRGLPDNRQAFDICRNLGFYELSFTKAPADFKALPQYVQGADITAAEPKILAPKAPKEEEVDAAIPTTETKDSEGLIDVKMPDDPMLTKLVDRAVNQAIKSRVNKLVKAEVDRVLGPYLKDMQVKVKPEIKEKVEDKKEDVKDVETVEPEK